MNIVFNNSWFVYLVRMCLCVCVCVCVCVWGGGGGGGGGDSDNAFYIKVYLLPVMRSTKYMHLFETELK